MTAILAVAVVPLWLASAAGWAFWCAVLWLMGERGWPPYAGGRG